LPQLNKKATICSCPHSTAVAAGRVARRPRFHRTDSKELKQGLNSGEIRAAEPAPGSTPVYDVVRGEVYRRAGDSPLVIPRDAIVVPGSRAVTSGQGKEWKISINTPVIVKYRDSKTDSSIRLEDLLR